MDRRRFLGLLAAAPAAPLLAKVEPEREYPYSLPHFINECDPWPFYGPPTGPYVVFDPSEIPPDFRWRYPIICHPT